MNTRLTTLRVVVFVATAWWLAACNRPEPVVISVSKDEIQQRLAAKFPVERSKLMTDVVLSDPEAILVPGADRAGLAVSVSVKPPLVGPFNGRLAATGKLDYRFEEKGFYLRDVTIDSLEIEGVDDGILAKIKGPVEAVALGYLAEHPVYELKDRNLKEITAAFVLRSVTVEDGQLKATIAPPL